MDGTTRGTYGMRHIVYGNGESRPRKPIVGGDFITWGCNAIYRDFTVDNLVSVDYNMQQEIYESGYAIRNKCWFSDWSILPDFDVDVIKMGWSDSEIYETAKLSRSNSSKMEFLTDCVVQGKTRELVESNIKEAMFHNPHLIEKDLRQKMEKDIGLIDDLVEDGEYEKIILWLKNKIHKYGRSLNSMDLVRKVTNEDLTSNYFISHLKSKVNDFC